MDEHQEEGHHRLKQQRLAVEEPITRLRRPQVHRVLEGLVDSDYAQKRRDYGAQQLHDDVDTRLGRRYLPPTNRPTVTAGL